MTFVRVVAILIVCSTVPCLCDPSLSLRFLFAFGEQGEAPGQMHKPTGVSTDAAGNIFVVDAGNHRLQKFNERGELIAFIGGFGWNARQFQMPRDVFVYNSLDVFVADYENHRIERYDKDLNWLASYYSNDNWDVRYRFFFPRAVAVSIHGNFFIADAEYRRIVKFSPRLEPELSFGDFDWGSGILLEPTAIALDRRDRIFVADASAGKVTVFDYFGNYLFEIGSAVLIKPTGVALDPFGNLFVVDSSKNRIFVFDDGGAVIYEFGSPGNKLGAFNEPLDICIHGNRLYLADTNNHRIQAFDMEWIR